MFVCYWLVLAFHACANCMARALCCVLFFLVFLNLVLYCSCLGKIFISFSGGLRDVAWNAMTSHVVIS